ncbi:MAG: transposase [Alphaproteobacteria bacterium]|nr:transposase [Alphaproteobacteria bacterium]
MARRHAAGTAQPGGRLTGSLPHGKIPKAKREELTGRGAIDMTTVAGAKDRDTNKVRAKVVPDTTRQTLQGFVRAAAAPGADLYTDESSAYTGMPEYRHEAVNHSVGEYVQGMASTNGIESFWSMMKR